MTKKLLITCIVMFLVVIGLAGYVFFGKDNKKKEEETAAKEKVQETATPEPTATPYVGEVNGVLNPEFTDTDSLLLLANKKHPLPAGYVPDDLVIPDVQTNGNTVYMGQEAAEALKEMFTAAANDGVTLLAGSGYRSEDYQRTLYNGYVQQYGVETADTISSRPGYSDHQTGLALDISDHDGATYLTQDMENTPEGQWLRKHAHEYGFIMRYPKGKQDITGYAYEPWHFRYVGKEWSEKIYSKGEFESFEEYFNVSGGDYAD